MAYSVIRVGKGRFEVCLECAHVDCAESRELIAKLCPYCGKPIGADTAFTYEERVPVHFFCALDAADAEQAARRVA